jgi:hypothetical protein
VRRQHQHIRGIWRLNLNGEILGLVKGIGRMIEEQRWRATNSGRGGSREDQSLTGSGGCPKDILLFSKCLGKFL